jgi:uncharacterized iron-regulated membrane protein
MNNSISICIFCAIAGLITGVSLGWLQWISIKNLGSKNPGKIISKVYVLSALRILFVSGILFLAFRQGLIYGLSLLITFIIGRWIWTLLALNIKSKYKE